MENLSEQIHNNFEESEFFSFDYSKISPRYRASSSPDDKITLYKGAVRGLHQNGFLSLALGEGKTDHLVEVKDRIHRGSDEEIWTILDGHTSYFYDTPFLSATFNPEAAQVFAPSSYRLPSVKTIYQLVISARRCILDAFDTGNIGRSKEVLILGKIFPDEITAVKNCNTPEASELARVVDGITRIKDSHDRTSENTRAKDPKNWFATEFSVVPPFLDSLNTPSLSANPE